MRTLVESLKRIYEAGKITYQKLTAMRDAGTITEEEYAYIRNDTVPA